jgi:cytidine deaminase
MPSRAIDFSPALSKLSRQPRDLFAPMLQAPGFRGFFTAAQVQMLSAQLGLTVPQFMTMVIAQATCYAQPAISGYSVGAVALGSSGALYFGANLEFPGESLIYTVHAEQAAIVNAWGNGEDGVTMLAVSAAPCGYCRQFLWELVTASQLQILLPNLPAQPLSYYLPNAFGPSDLGVTAGLLAPRHHKLILDRASLGRTSLDQPSLDQASANPVLTAALAAANRSYAPYTSEAHPNAGKACYAGVALKTADGSIFSGSYGENAAYNPAIQPMEAALIQMNLCGRYTHPITEAVLVQARMAGQRGPNPLCDQERASRNVLATVTDVPLTVAYAHP